MTSESNDNECLSIWKIKDLYEVLKLPKTASEDDIRKAYKRMAIKFHPDKNKSPHAEEAFKKVNQAFSVLSDKTKRQNYDMFGTEGETGMNGFGMNGDFDPFDVFNMFFSGQGFGPMGQGGFRSSGQSGGGGRTRVQFNNGNVSYTMFTNGGFGGGDDDDDDPFSQLFGNFGGGGIRFRQSQSQSQSQSNGRRRHQQNENRTDESERQRDFNKKIRQIMTCVQYCPLIFCLIFIVIPVFLRSLV